MTGVYFLSSELNNLIHENDILPINDYIIFVFDYEDENFDSDNEDIYTIELAKRKIIMRMINLLYIKNNMEMILLKTIMNNIYILVNQVFIISR